VPCATSSRKLRSRDVGIIASSTCWRRSPRVVTSRLSSCCARSPMLRRVKKQNDSMGDFNTLVPQERTGSGSGSDRPRLGSNGDLFQLPVATMAAPAYHQSGGVAALGSASEDGCRTQVQEGGQRSGRDLEDVAGCGEEIPSSKGPSPDEVGLSGSPNMPMECPST
jgi:hypothetical protein